MRYIYTTSANVTKLIPCRYKWNYLILYIKCTIFLSDFKKIWIFSKYFYVSVQYKISRTSFQFEMRWCMWTDGRTWSKITFIPTMPTQIKTNVATWVIYKTEFRLHGILEVSTHHCILSPATKRLYKYLYLLMTCHFVPSEAIVFISSRQFN